MEGAVPVMQYREPGPAIADDFLEEIRKLIDHGLLARAPGNLFKSQIVERVQNYSAQLPFVRGETSGLFLELCDLMVNGKLAGMPVETFKIYIVLLTLTYSNTQDREGIKDIETLRELTGISDIPTLNRALEQLQLEGYIESVEHPIIRSRRAQGKKGHSTMGKPLAP